MNLKNFQILFDSKCILTLVIIRLLEKLRREKDIVMQWHIQAGNITSNIKFKVYFTLPELSAMYVVTCNFHVDYSAKGIYDTILGQYILT